MKKLTAEKCRKQIEIWGQLAEMGIIACQSEQHLEAYQIALPILEQQESGVYLPSTDELTQLRRENATLRDINLNISREAYSSSIELQSAYFSLKSVYQVMNQFNGEDFWVDVSRETYEEELSEGGIARELKQESEGATNG